MIGSARLSFEAATSRAPLPPRSRGRLRFAPRKPVTRPRADEWAGPGRVKSSQVPYASAFETIAHDRRAPGGSKRGIGHAELLSRYPAVFLAPPDMEKGSRNSRRCKAFERRRQHARRTSTKCQRKRSRGDVPTRPRFAGTRAPRGTQLWTQTLRYGSGPAGIKPPAAGGKPLPNKLFPHRTGPSGTGAGDFRDRPASPAAVRA
jgi:hypothetical protein